jgi:hypothetical protein
MVVHSRASCPYIFFLGINIGNVVHPAINSVLKEEEVCRYDTIESEQPQC